MTSDPFAMYDGAYVMGALSDSDRSAYEAHLTVCDECSASVRDLIDLPGLLATVPAAALVEEMPPPQTLLPALQRRMRRDANRRRWLMGGVAAAAAACLVTVAVLVSRPDSAPAGHPVAMAHAAGVKAPLAATADVRDVAWGTSIEVVCHYYNQVHSARPYALVVVDKSGHSFELGTWNLAPGKVTTYSSGTALRRQDIKLVEITTVRGKALLTLQL